MSNSADRPIKMSENGTSVMFTINMETREK